MRMTLLAGLVLASALTPVQARELSCKLSYSMSGGGVFYKHSKGSGVVHCDNGQTLAVSIEAKGGGLTFGHSEIKNGVGKFSGISSIDDVVGGYATAEANAAAGSASKAQVVTKGSISLALTGKGTGHELGVSFGSFIISRAGK